jgi:hypothetical protein
MRLGYYSTIPDALGQNQIAGHYCQGSHFRTMFDNMSNKFPGSLVVLIIVWTDGVQFSTNRQGHGEGHPCMVSLAAAPANTPLKLFGFLNINTKIEGPETRLSSILRCLGSSASLVAMFQEMKDIQDQGGVYFRVWGNEVRVIPFIAYMAADLVEHRRNFGSLHCPFCNIEENGRRLSAATKAEVTKIEAEQKKVRSEDGLTPASLEILEKHRVYYISQIHEQNKRVLCFRDVLGMEFGTDFYFEPVPDPMHVLGVGEGKRMLHALFSDIPKAMSGAFNSRMKLIRLLPRSLSNCLLRPTTVSTDYSMGVILMTLVLASTTRFVLETVKRSEEQKKQTTDDMELDYVQQFSALGILIMVASKSALESSDLAIVDDAKTVLISMLDDYDIFHLLVEHLFDEDLWKRLGAISNFSCARFEAGLSSTKSSLRRASNRVNNWTHILLKRAIFGDILTALIDSARVDDPRKKPQFKKLISMSDNLMRVDISTIDIARANSFSSKRTKLEIYSYAPTSSRYAFVTFKSKGIDQVGQILQFKSAAKQGGSFILGHSAYSCILRLGILKEVKLSKEREEKSPHYALFLPMNLTEEECEINIGELIGTNYHFKENNIFWIGSNDVSHIIVPGAGPSRMNNNDPRF